VTSLHRDWILLLIKVNFTASWWNVNNKGKTEFIIRDKVKSKSKAIPVTGRGGL
jgi:hypothetical protein